MKTEIETRIERGLGNEGAESWRESPTDCQTSVFMAEQCATNSETKSQGDLRPACIGAIGEATRGGTDAHAWHRPQDTPRGLICLGGDRRVAHPVEDVECFEIQVQTVTIG